MSRYIDAELFSKNLMMQVYLADDEDFTKAFVKGMELVKKAEEETPTADVQEVKHGHWARLGWDERCCTCCGFVTTTEGSWDKPTEKYCPECGAKMDGGKHET